MDIPNIVSTKLPNGIRIIVEPIPYVASVSIGLWVGTGSRYENKEELGISHVVEHMLFKGTEKRNAKQIAEEIESVGGHLNAFTDKEMTTYYARILSEYYPVAVDILTDMLLNSLLSQSDLTNEQSVVLEEIKRRDDNPEDKIHDLFLETLWKDHPLGISALGTRETVASFTSDNLRKYIHRTYVPERIIVSAAGMIDPEEFIKLVSDRLSVLDRKGEVTEKSKPIASGNDVWIEDENEQVHFCIGSNGFSHHEQEKYTVAVIDTILGGGMSSRLFQEIREKRGLAYSIGSYASAYAEGGQFAVYGGTSPSTCQEVFDLVDIELDKMKNEPVNPKELEKVKNLICGSMLIAMEGMSQRMMRLGKNVLYYDRVVPMEETIKSIRKVNTDDIMRISQILFSADTLTRTAIGPKIK